MDYKEAAKTMIDGAICIDKDGYKWRYSEGIRRFVYYDDNTCRWCPMDPRAELEPFTIKREPVKYPIEVWVNVYEGGGYAPHVTKEDAECFASGKVVARIKLTGVAEEGDME